MTGQENISEVSANVTPSETRDGFIAAKNPKEGDIFRWRYKNEKPGDCAAFSRYHCKSQIAIFDGVSLHDTYWSGSSYEGHIIRADVVLDFQGNMHEMQKISPGERVFYRHQDIMDMNHPNNSRAPVYVKVGAARDPETMKAYFEYAIDNAKRDIASAHRRINDCEEALAAIASGDLARHFPVYS